MAIPGLTLRSDRGFMNDARLLLAIVPFFCGGLIQPGIAAPVVSFEDRLLAKVPADAECGLVAFSPDGRHVAFSAGGSRDSQVSVGH